VGAGLCVGINELKFETLRRRIAHELDGEMVDSIRTTTTSPSRSL
jgi:hypothetical protein